jgi:hypothetical protein
MKTEESQNTEYTNKLKYQAHVLTDLHSMWIPHEGQIEAGRAIWYDGKTYIFVECGRKWGKSEFGIYCAYRSAMTTPNAPCYYIAPFAKQAREIIWANNRLQNFLKGPLALKYIKSVNNTEMRINFRNGSFIKLDGADNYEAYRGINPMFIIYDEFKDHNPKFHEAMEPNLATFNAPLLIIGTPPETEDNLFCRLAKQIMEDKADGAYFNQPTITNPHISKTFLEKMRERLIARGEYDVWLREYMARRVKGGRNAIFPMLSKEKHLKPFEVMVNDIRHSRKHWEFFITCDPATSSTFAVLFSAINKHTKVVYHLDEIYTSDTSANSARKVWDRIESMYAEIHPILEDWTLTYDEAATWFANEVSDITQGEVNFFPTHKSLSKKEKGLSLIKDQMLFGFWFYSDRCNKLFYEAENYVRDDNGKIPKENDHLIDCARYTNAVCHYSMIPGLTALPNPDYEKDREPRFKTMSQDRREEVADWTEKLLGERYYDD